MYKTKNIIKSVILFSFICSCYFGCFGPTIKFTKTTMATLSEQTPNKQSLGGITIDLAVLPDDESDKSFYKQPIHYYAGTLLGDESGMATVDEMIHYFANMTPFKVTIINDTRHILRMRDSRIIFIDPDSDEPVFALNKESIKEDIESLPSYKVMKDKLKTKYSGTKPEYLEPQIVKAFEKVTKKVKFINGFNREIMPGMKLTGVICFPIDPKTTSQGKISFIDMVSETDEAGNPTKKERFDYIVDTKDRYWRYNSDIDKDWTEIDKKEFDGGNQTAK